MLEVGHHHRFDARRRRPEVPDVLQSENEPKDTDQASMHEEWLVCALICRGDVTSQADVPRQCKQMSKEGFHDNKEIQETDI